jgi:hypothetical protein
MAKQTGLFKFTGKLDNVIGYRRNGVHFVRSMPDKVRQSSATRKASRHFGAASRKGKLIRKAITPYLDLRYDGSLVNRLNKALVQAGAADLQGIEGFRFSQYTGIEKLMPLSPICTSNGLVNIPAQLLAKPGTYTHLEISVIAAKINFAERRTVNVETAVAIIDLQKPFDGMELKVPVGGKGTLVVVLQVRACTVQNGAIQAIGDRRYIAADIIGIIPPMPRPALHNRRHCEELRWQKRAGRRSNLRSSGRYAEREEIASPSWLAMTGMKTPR